MARRKGIAHPEWGDGNKGFTVHRGGSRRDEVIARDRLPAGVKIGSCKL